MQAVTNTIMEPFNYIRSKANMGTINDLGDELAKPMTKNPIVKFLVGLGIILYIVFFAPHLNKRVVKMLHNPFIKMALLIVIFALSRPQASPSIALLLAIAILVSYQTAGTELMTNVSGHKTTVKGDCSCVEWECGEADGSTMSFDSHMGDGMLPGHDPSAAMHHPSPEELLHAHEQGASAEDHAVKVVVEEKAKMEEQLQRPLSQEELQDLCAKVNSEMPAHSSAVESFDNVVGFSGTAYASA